MGFSREEYWSGLTFPPPGDLLDQAIKLKPPALAGGLFTTEPPGKSPQALDGANANLWQCPSFNHANKENDGEGNGNPLQYSCLENPMDGGAW